jgi:anti-sigma-K factor RskA
MKEGKERMKNGKGRKKKKKEEKGPGAVACLAFVAGLSSEVAEASAQERRENPLVVWLWKNQSKANYGFIKKRSDNRLQNGI